MAHERFPGGSQREPKMALLTPESQAKIASFIAPKGGKQSVRLNAVRLLAGALPRTPSIPRRCTDELEQVRPCRATCAPVCRFCSLGRVM